MLDLTSEFDKAVGEINEMAKKLNGGAMTPSVDVGGENIDRASELSSAALRQAFEETAKRALDLAEANLARAQADRATAEKFAEAVRAHGESMARQLEEGFGRAKTMCTTMASTRAMIEQ